eukprot:GGOE01002229.1.p1 GENE.GGOE01002229.1~~GGOE01002229.1.p1  ORF type:complete len:546 (-),score=53.33 GGOE01002229.1:468-2105(-)
MFWRKSSRSPQPRTTQCETQKQRKETQEPTAPMEQWEILQTLDGAGHFQCRHQLFAELAKASKLPVALEVSEDCCPATRHQGDLQFYTPEMLEARRALRSNPNVLAALDGMWNTVPKKLHYLVDRAIYFEVYTKLYEQLVPDQSAAAIACSLAQDWEHDRQGSQVLSREMFFDSMFDLTDMWCASVSEEEYTCFIKCCTTVCAKRDTEAVADPVGNGEPEESVPRPSGLLDAWRASQNQMIGLGASPERGACQGDDRGSPRGDTEWREISTAPPKSKAQSPTSRRAGCPRRKTLPLPALPLSPKPHTAHLQAVAAELDRAASPRLPELGLSDRPRGDPTATSLVQDFSPPLSPTSALQLAVHADPEPPPLDRPPKLRPLPLVPVPCAILSPSGCTRPPPSPSHALSPPCNTSGTTPASSRSSSSSRAVKQPSPRTPVPEPVAGRLRASSHARRSLDEMLSPDGRFSPGRTPPDLCRDDPLGLFIAGTPRTKPTSILQKVSYETTRGEVRAGCEGKQATHIIQPAALSRGVRALKARPGALHWCQS